MKTNTELAPVEAMWRAMPPMRMLDCGMDYGDVLALERLTGAGTPWDVALEKLAGAQLERASAAHADGRTATAFESYRAAAADLLFAQMAYNFDEPRKHELYARFNSAVSAAGSLMDPIWERLELPFGDGSLFGWLLRPTRPAIGTTMIFGGQSGWGAAYLRQADAFMRRGMAALLVEGPGQGQTRLSGNIMLDVDIPAAYSTFVDHVVERPDLGGTIGLWGNSLGGLYAAATAASDDRVSAVCVNGAPASPRLLPFRTFREQAAAMLGTAEPERIEANFERIRFRAGVDRIACPLLVLHGGNDPIVSLDDQQPFLEAATHDDVTLRVWDDGEHTIYNHASERNAFVADWFAARYSKHAAPSR